MIFFYNTGLIYFDVGTKYPKIILDNYEYLMYRKESGRTLWKCRSYYGNKDIKDRCKSSLVTSGIIYFDVGTKYPKIILDQYEYRIYRKESGRTLWKCRSYFGSKDGKDRCKSTLETSGKIVNVNADFHNHAPPQKNKFKRTLSQTVTIVRAMSADWTQMNQGGCGLGPFE
ncbi:unnamed protein product [Psylliodes chrysocephalus]|uniref:FLYWCH-type domain-containing protein n=1 Tax=Psylliodes chrysocephalus TaxID=3402493 RepID=A0A9P0G7A0_9CUCU|nr:unnamed protein product [Psylliodes chrysocephala]